MDYTPIYMENDEILYLGNLEINGQDSFKKFHLSNEQIKNALKPIIKLGQNVKETIKEISPDQVEITMQISIGIENNNFIFSLVNSTAEAQLSVKYLWNK